MQASDADFARQLPDKVLEEARRGGQEDLLTAVPLVVGVSGGADSLALLHMLVQIRGASAPATVHVAHLDHGFRGDEGAADARFVAATAAGWGLRSTIEAIDVPEIAARDRLSAEEAAREARYAFLARVARSTRAHLVAVAHTLDDQAETVLMALMRGAGTNGLAGMRTVSPLPGCNGELSLYRPLLAVRRSEIETYCYALGLAPRSDTSNSSRDYFRNRVRLDLIPLLERDYSPGFRAKVARLAGIVAAEDDLLDTLASDVWSSVISDESGDVLYVRTGAFGALHPALARRLVRHAIARLAGTLDNITFDQVEAAVEALSEGLGARRVSLPHGLEAGRRGAEGWIGRTSPTKGDAAVARASERWPMMQSGDEIVLTVGEPARLKHGWSARVELAETGEYDAAGSDLAARFDFDRLGDPESLLLRTRWRGDAIRPLGMAGRRSLQDLMVDAKIPADVRERIPLLVLAGTGEVLWVPGPQGRRSGHAPITPATTRTLCVRFERDAREGDQK